MKKYFIYKYTFPNGKVYVGQSYVGSNRYGNPSQYKKQVVGRAMNKYHIFKKEIICHCCEYLVDYLESYYISKYDSMNPDHGYNRESGGNLNKQFSEETRKKMSESGKIKYFYDEWRQHMSEARIGEKNHFYGKHHSEETKKKLSKPVYCEELNKEFYGAKAAAEEVGIDRRLITACCKGRQRTAGGYHWCYKEVS